MSCKPLEEEDLGWVPCMDRNGWMKYYSCPTQSAGLSHFPPDSHPCFQRGITAPWRTETSTWPFWHLSVAQNLAFDTGGGVFRK